MNVCLRRTLESDIDFVLSAENADENLPFIIAWTREQHMHALSNRDLQHLIIERCVDAGPVGYVILAGLGQVHQSIELRRMVVTEKNKGYGREALRLIKKKAFEELCAHRLWLDVKDHNLHARHVYESEGFIVEGVLRECIKSTGKFESLVVLSILQGEYQNACN